MSLLAHIDEAYEIAPAQRLMLRALILEAPRDKECFSRWLAEADFDALDKPALRLLPALFRKFADAGVENPHHARMKGIYRHYHFRNSLLFAESRRTLERMLDAGIDVLLFKGFAIALKYHRNIAIRPMADIDILVRRESVPRAERILLNCGWKYAYPQEKKCTDLHSHDYINSRFNGFDLHWYSLLESPCAGCDDGIWQRAEFFDWDGLVVKIMSPEDLLLTSVVNGVRDNPISPQWINDVAAIVAAEPVIPWTVLWQEATSRGLREVVFNALNLVRVTSRKIIPDALLENFLSKDPEFCRGQLNSAIAEGRTHRLKRAAIVPGAANPLTSPQHVRYFLNDENSIDKLFLQWQHLPFLAELFEVNNGSELDILAANRPKTGEGYLNIPPGLLLTKPKLGLPVYSARIAVEDGLRTLDLKPGESSEITVQIENDSPCCWPVCSGSNTLLGLSYHLHSENGALLTWDFPRTYLSAARKEYVAFIEPAQKLACKLKIIAPGDPGRYIVQLDLVYEGDQWFSNLGIQFPRIDIEVRRHKPIDCYVVIGPGIVHETIAHESVIINTVSGTYYTTSGYGSLIWNAIVQGYSSEQIISAFASASIFGANDGIVEQFISQLFAEQLIVAPDSDKTGPHGKPHLERLFESQTPVLTSYSDLRELTAMHPVRGASAQAAWPKPDGASA